MASHQLIGNVAILNPNVRTGRVRVQTDHIFFRFFICHFNDAITQCAIDILLGQEINMATVENFDSLWRDIKTASLILYENMDIDRSKLEMMPSYFGHGMTSELAGAEVAYGLGRSVLYWLCLCNKLFTHYTSLNTFVCIFIYLLCLLTPIEIVQLFLISLNVPHEYNNHH